MRYHKVKNDKFIALCIYDYHELLFALAPYPAAFQTLLKSVHSKKNHIVLIKKKKLNKFLTQILRNLCCESNIELPKSIIKEKIIYLDSSEETSTKTDFNGSVATSVGILHFHGAKSPRKTRRL